MTNGYSDGEMAARVRAYDWSQTSLGPMNGWPVSLRAAASMVLENRFPMTMWWGSDLLHIYNDAYIPVLSGKHPHALGRPAAQVWREIWHILGPQCDYVTCGKGATWNEHLLLPMNRKGFVEETYFTFSYSPLRNDQAGIGGVLVTCQETTAHVQSERQLRMLHDLGAHPTMDSAEEVCRSAANILAQNPTDLPFAMIYLIDGDNSDPLLIATASPAPSDVSAPAPNVPVTFRRRQWPFSETRAAGGSLVLDDLAGRVGPLRVSAHPPIERAIILALTRAGSPTPHGYLVAGLNPLRPLDERYRELFRLTGEQIATAIASARAYEEERKRAEALAALDQAKTAFFSNVSHEFRTPLTLMLGPIEDLLDQGDAIPAPALQEQLELVHRNGLRLLKLVNTMLDFSRIEDGCAHAVYQPTDIAAYTAELTGIFRAAIEDAGLRLEREHVDELSRYSELRYRDVVESQAEMVCRFRADGTIIFVNEPYARACGASSKELAGAKIWRIITEADRPGVQRLLDKLSPEAPEISIENRIDTPNGARWTLWTNRALAFDKDGRMTEAQSTGIDISARKEVEEALRKTSEELEARVTERTEELERQNLRLRQLAHQLTDAEQRERRQLAQILHDGLQQILVAVKMQLPMCLGSDAPGAVDRIRDLIDEAVKTSRSLSYELSPPALHSSPLPEALEWLVRWIGANHKFHVTLDTASDFPGLSDQTKTFAFNAVRELLLNSVKHSGATAAKLSLRRLNGEVAIAVADEGHGFDPADLERHDDKTRGFGLFSMRERLAALGGTLRIDTAPGKGARFELAMPADGTDAVHMTAVVTSQKKFRVTKTGPRAPGGPVRVLIADDHGIFREGLTSLLEGHEDIELVGEARDGVEAVARTDELRPHVIIMDVNMPRMNGIEATRLIKRKHPGISVIGLSFYEEQEMADAMRRAGASAYLAKGGVADMLLNTIRQLLPNEHV